MLGLLRSGRSLAVVVVKVQIRRLLSTLAVVVVKVQIRRLLGSLAIVVVKVQVGGLLSWSPGFHCSLDYIVR